MSETPHVAVETLKYHTLDGEAHNVGEVYEARADVVDSLVAQGMATPAVQPHPVPPAPSDAPTPNGEAKRRR